MSVNTLDCLSNPLTQVKVSSGWWIDNIQNACGRVGSSTGGSPNLAFTCPNSNTPTGGGITKVNYAQGPVNVGKLQFVCDDGTKSNMYGLGYDTSGNAVNATMNTYSCPTSTYLSKINATDYGQGGGIANLSFGCTQVKQPTAIINPISLAPIAPIPIAPIAPIKPIAPIAPIAPIQLLAPAVAPIVSPIAATSLAATAASAVPDVKATSSNTIVSVSPLAPPPVPINSNIPIVNKPTTPSVVTTTLPVVPSSLPIKTIQPQLNPTNIIPSSPKSSFSNLITSILDSVTSLFSGSSVMKISIGGILMIFIIGALIFTFLKK